MACIGILLLTPDSAFAWGPVTHVALGVQVLAGVVTPDHPLRATLLAFPEVFLYGSLAPDIVQGRRLQSRLRRHSHNWATGVGLLKSAPGEEERAFAFGYLAHLAADVVAHNFFLPARFIGRFDTGVASHILTEARFDSFHPKDFRDLLANLMNSNFSELDSLLKKSIDSPFIAFAAHRGIFAGALRRIRQFDSLVRSLGGPSESERRDVELFTAASTSAIATMLAEPEHGAAVRFDPMGEEAVRSALKSRRDLARLRRMSPKARQTARRLADTMIADLEAHLRTTPFGAAAPS
jgi:hypothetical protein